MLAGLNKTQYLILLTALLLQACSSSSRYKINNDHGPAAPVDVSDIKNAIPKNPKANIKVTNIPRNSPIDTIKDIYLPTYPYLSKKTRTSITVESGNLSCADMKSALAS